MTIMTMPMIAAVRSFFSTTTTTTTRRLSSSSSSSLQWVRPVQARLADHLQPPPTTTTTTSPTATATAATTDLMAPAMQSSRAGDLYFQSRRDQVARAAPQFVLPSCLLPPGHVVTDDLFLLFSSSSSGGHSSSKNNNNNNNNKPTPIFVYRDPTTGKVHAYINQCRHRGAQLVMPPPTTTTTTTSVADDADGSSTSFCSSSSAATPAAPGVTSTQCIPPRRWKGFAVTCPYHSWTYDIRDGSLKKIPGQEVGFPCLNHLDDRQQQSSAQFGLQKLPCREMAGGIWVGGTTTSTGMGMKHDDSLEEEDGWWSIKEIDQEVKDLWLDPLQDDPQKKKKKKNSTNIPRLVGFREWKLNANWQLLVETFLESYHVQHLHQTTLGLVTHGNCMVTDRLEEHQRSLRHTVPLSNFDISAAAAAAADSSTMAPVVSPDDPFFHQTTTTYFAFPSVSISLFKRFAAFMSIVPDPITTTNDVHNGSSSSSSSSSRVRLWAVTHTTAAAAAAAAAAANGDDDDDDDDYFSLFAKQQRRDMERVLQGLQEDWDCAERIQHGLTEDTIVHHGRFEGNNIDFLRNVGELSKRLQ